MCVCIDTRGGIREEFMTIGIKTKNMYVGRERSAGIYPIKILMHNSIPRVKGRWIEITP